MGQIIHQGAESSFQNQLALEYLGRKAGISKIHTFFGFKNGKLVSVLQSLDGDAKKAVDCTYYIVEPKELEKQIEKWKKENLA